MRMESRLFKEGNLHLKFDDTLFGQETPSQPRSREGFEGLDKHDKRA